MILGLPRGSTEEVVVACKDDKICDEMCGSVPGSGKCIDGKCECLSGKFAEQNSLKITSPKHDNDACIILVNICWISTSLNKEC